MMHTTRVYRSQRARHYEGYRKSERQRGDGSDRVRDRPAESPFERKGGNGRYGRDGGACQLQRRRPEQRAPRQPVPDDTCSAHPAPDGGTGIEAEASRTDWKLNALQMKRSFRQLMANQRAACVENAGHRCRQKGCGDEQQQPGGSNSGDSRRGPARHDWIVTPNAIRVVRDTRRGCAAARWRDRRCGR